MKYISFNSFTFLFIVYYKNPHQNMTSDRFEYEAIVLDTVGEPCEYKIAISVFINFSNLSSQSRCISASKINRLIFFAMQSFFSMIK